MLSMFKRIFNYIKWQSNKPATSSDILVAVFLIGIPLCFLWMLIIAYATTHAS